jgi:chromosome segregation ATPase
MILGAIVAIGLIFGYGHNRGWNARDAEMQAEIAKKNAEARATEIKLNEQINANANKLAEANNAITEKQTALDRAIRAGRVRISTPTSCVPAPASAPAPTGDRDEAPSESERQTLAAIAAIVAEADRHINQLNACIDSYEKVREQLNAKR